MRLLFFLPLLLSFSSTAQVLYRQSLQAEAFLPWHKTLGLHWEFARSDRSALTLSASFEQHDSGASGLSAGERLGFYTERRSTHNRPDGVVSELAFLGEDRPIPSAPERTPVFSGQLRFGRQHLFRARNDQRPAFYLLPVFTLTLHRYLETRLSTMTESLETDYQYVDEGYFSPVLVQQVTTQYRQLQSTRRHDAWFPGVYYEMGVLWPLGWRLVATTSAAVGANMFRPYREALPAIASGGYFRANLRLGFLLGGKMKRIKWIDGPLPIRY